ncbi:MAG: prolyl-tRNA synthetase associated domain-containing protein [Planctomycetota bacterium]|jgi:Ala-tRNA(Pro) deacylase
MDIYEFLHEHGVTYERHDHRAVFTVEEAERFVPELPGAKTKNLFLRDHKGKNHYMVVVGADHPVDLKALAPFLGAKKLSFASPERLKKHLDIEPGSVSILAMMNDLSGKVGVFVDRAVWDAEAVLAHPLVNTSTLVIPREGIRRFLEASGHEARVIDVPRRTDP